jgi:centromeric protein E
MSDMDAIGASQQRCVGVTGSGKTYTMLGEARRAGLIAMSLEHLFHLIGQNSDRYYLLKLSMLEIYNEVINDLLDPGSTNLVLREDAAKGQVMVAGVKNVEVCTAPPPQPTTAPQPSSY